MISTRREASALPAALAAAARAVVQSVSKVTALGSAATADALRLAYFCQAAAIRCLAVMLFSPWTSAAALRAGSDMSLVEICHSQVRSLPAL